MFFPVLTANHIQDGRSRGQTRGAAVHQRGCHERERRRAGLLPHVRVGPVRSDGRHPRADGTSRLRFLLPVLLPPLSVAHPESGPAMEQMLQISAAALHWRSRRGPFHLRPVLDLPVRNGARVLRPPATKIIAMFPCKTS